MSTIHGGLISSEWPRSFISIDQLSGRDIRALIDDAQRLLVAAGPPGEAFSIGLIMLQASLRTRMGFAEAARRLGGHAHFIDTLRHVTDAVSERLDDTIQVVGGMADLVVVRADAVISDIAASCPVPIINGGDWYEHPSQALVDLFATERLCGPIETLSVGVCGDLSMRAARSFLKVLAKVRPQRLRLIAPPSRLGDAEAIVAPLGATVQIARPGDLHNLDVLYLAGLPARKGEDFLPQERRDRYAFHPGTEGNLPPAAHVISPMPVIDEIEASLRNDPRVSIFQQSRLGIAVRMAVLNRMLGRP